LFHPAVDAWPNAGVIAACRAAAHYPHSVKLHASSGIAGFSRGGAGRDNDAPMLAQPSPVSAADALLDRVSLRSFDPGVMRQSLQHGSVEHVQLEGGVFEGTVTHSASERLRVDWGRYNLPVQAKGSLSPDMLTVGLLLSGEGGWRTQGAAADRGDMVLYAEGGELLVNLPANAQWLAVQVSRQRLDALGIPLGRLRGASAWRLSAIPGEAGADLSDVAPFLTPLHTSADADESHVQAAQEQLFSLLFSEWERRRAHIGLTADKLDPGERLRVLRRAEAYIESRSGVNCRVDEMCVAACTSLSTLERVFREVYGVAPRRYLALRRLAGVRNELLNGDPGQSVTEIATRWGFFHLGRFAQEYSQLYHERPSQTKAAAAYPWFPELSTRLAKSG